MSKKIWWTDSTQISNRKGSDERIMNLEPRRRYFDHDGLRLHYWEWGDPKEETYVFVHGVRDQGRSWDHFLEALLQARCANPTRGGARFARAWR